MTGELNLATFLQTMSPELIGGEYVFCTFENASYGAHSHLQPIASFVEQEGLTLVVPRAKAKEHALAFQSVFRCITLKVHSSLDAVGLTAAFSNKLSEHGISANVIAGYFHDHIFVPSDIAEKAIKALNELARP